MRQRALIAAVGGSVLVVAGACGGDGGSNGAGDGEFESGPLVVLGSSPEINDAWQANVDRQFTELTGASITWVPGSAPTNLTQLITSQGGAPPADVVFLDTPTQTQAIEAGLLDEFDRSLLTESGDQLPDDVFPNEGYGPANIVIRLGTCVNTEVLDDAGLDYPNSLEDWFDPAYEGLFMMPDIDTFYVQATLPAIAQHYGIDYSEGPDEVLDLIESANPTSFWTSTADAQQSLQSGEIGMTPILDGRCLNLELQGEPVQFLPLNIETGGENYKYVGLYDTWDLVAGTDKPNLAHAFVDIAANEASMSVLQEEFGYLPARTDLLAAAKEDPALSDMVGDYELEDLLVPDYREWFEYSREWQDGWNQRFKG